MSISGVDARDWFHSKLLKLIINENIQMWSLLSNKLLFVSLTEYLIYFHVYVT